MQDAVWVLPATPQTREQLQWLAAEIQELHGRAMLWESRLVLDGPQQELVEHFTAPVQAAYRKMLRKLKMKRPDLAALARRYQQVQATDHFCGELSQRVRAALLNHQTGEQRKRRRKKS